MGFENQMFSVSDDFLETRFANLSCKTPRTCCSPKSSIFWWMGCLVFDAKEEKEKNKEAKRATGSSLTRSSANRTVSKSPMRINRAMTSSLSLTTDAKISRHEPRKSPFLSVTYCW